MHLLTARKGKAELIKTPDPVPAENELLIETAFSAISHGTEMAALSQQPATIFEMVERGIQSWQKIQTSLARRGWRQTLAKVEEKVDQPIPLGYSLSGRVLRIGSAVEDFHAGDWVVAVGPCANHGSIASVPRLFCARLPNPEMARDASAAALGCVGIHAIHRAELSAGSEVAVLGLGVIGQFTVQALRASGHRVVAFDPVASRREDARLSGADVYDPEQFDFEKAASLSSHQHGLDAVFLCLKTDSPEVLRQATALCRKRGRLIVVGEFPIQLPRESVYQKELEVRVSAAYGDGRYDPNYERLDQDYPIEHSRWTVRRNLELFLRWLEEDRIQPALLRPELFPFSEAPQIYSQSTQTRSVLTFIQYTPSSAPCLSLEQAPRSIAGANAIPIAVLGAGRFATETHLPHLRQLSDKFDLHAVIGKNPLKTSAAAAKFHPRYASCNFEKALADSSLSAVLIATPHAQHASQVQACLESGKHVYVEKPLCIHPEEMASLRKICKSSGVLKSGKPVLFVGFNRRYAPLSQKILEWRIHHRNPIDMRYIFHAVPAPKEDWYDHPQQGGRFVGEVCHAIDWILWIAGSALKSHQISRGPDGSADILFQFDDSSRVQLRFQPAWQSTGPKEIVEIRQGTVRWYIEDFLHLQRFDRDSMSGDESWKSKGHREALDAFASAIVRPKPGEDPYGFLASSELVLELNSALH